MAIFNENADVKLYYDNIQRFATTSTGVNVTGTVTADGLTVDGSGTAIFSGGQYIRVDGNAADVTDLSPVLWARSKVGASIPQINVKGSQWQFGGGGSLDPNPAMTIDYASGDISFYEDTGTTAKFFWDASTERLGIGTSSPNSILEVSGTNAGAEVQGLRLTNSSTATSTSSSIIFNLSTVSADSAKIAAIRTNSPTSSDTELAFSQSRNGTLTERMRIDSDGNVGIGTSSPAAKLEIDGGTGSATSGGTLVVRQKGDTSADGIAITSSDSVSHRIWKDASGNLNIGSSSFPSSFVQDFNGNVGIGTATPAALLNTKGDDALLLESTGSDNYGFHVTVDYGTDMVKLGALDSADGSKDGSTITFGDFGRDIQFSTNKGASLSEAMRIDSNGNLLVGKTSPDTMNTVGAEVQADGQIKLAADGKYPLQVNRLSSNGEIINLRADGGTVGTISAASTNVIYGNDTRGLKIEDTVIIPRDVDDTNADNAIDLGSGFSRFKDLYLSGGAFLGGTAAANKLDSYEDGGWIPTLTGTTSGSATVTVTTANYTKIGNVVHVYGQISVDLSSHNIVGAVQIGGLPFTASPSDNGSGNAGYNALVNGPVVFRPLGSSLRLTKGTTSAWLDSELLSGASALFMFQATYRTS
jgi:hypothetical protein